MDGIVEHHVKLRPTSSRMEGMGDVEHVARKDGAVEHPAELRPTLSRTDSHPPKNEIEQFR